MLKIILMVKVLLLLGLCTNAKNNIAQFGGLEDKILKLVKEFTDRMCHDLERFGIPALDPFKQKHFDASIDNPLAQINGSVSDVEAIGLSDIKIENLKASPTLVMSLKATIPELSLKGNFKAKGMLGELFPIDGKGKFKFIIEELTIDTKFRLYSTPAEVYVKELSATPAVKKVHANIENLVPNKEINDFINEVLNNRSPELLQALWEETGTEILAGIEELSKYLLKDVTGKDITGIILGKPVFNEKDPDPNCKKLKV